MVFLRLYAEALSDCRPAIVRCMERMKAPSHHQQHRADARAQVEMRYLAICVYYPKCMCAHVMQKVSKLTVVRVEDIEVVIMANIFPYKSNECSNIQFCMYDTILHYPQIIGITKVLT